MPKLQWPVQRTKTVQKRARSRFEDNLAEESRKHLLEDRYKEMADTYKALRLAVDEIDVGAGKKEKIGLFFPMMQKAFLRASQGAAELGSRSPINDVNLEGLNDMVLYGQQLVQRWGAFCQPDDDGKMRRRCEIGLCVHKITIRVMMDACLNAYEHLLPHSIKEKHTDIQPNVNILFGEQGVYGSDNTLTVPYVRQQLGSVQPGAQQ